MSCIEKLKEASAAFGSNKNFDFGIWNDDEQLESIKNKKMKHKNLQYMLMCQRID